MRTRDSDAQAAKSAERFLAARRDVFVGAWVEGQSAFTGLKPVLDAAMLFPSARREIAGVSVFSPGCGLTPDRVSRTSRVGPVARSGMARSRSLCPERREFEETYRGAA